MNIHIRRMTPGHHDPMGLEVERRFCQIDRCKPIAKDFSCIGLAHNE